MAASRNAMLISHTVGIVNSEGAGIGLHCGTNGSLGCGPGRICRIHRPTGVKLPSSGLDASCVFTYGGSFFTCPGGCGRCIGCCHSAFRRKNVSLRRVVVPLMALAPGGWRYGSGDCVGYVYGHT